MRDDGKHPDGEIDKKLFTTEHPAWKKLAERMGAAGVRNNALCLCSPVGSGWQGPEMEAAAAAARWWWCCAVRQGGEVECSNSSR